MHKHELWASPRHELIAKVLKWWCTELHRPNAARHWTLTSVCSVSNYIEHTEMVFIWPLDPGPWHLFLNSACRPVARIDFFLGGGAAPQKSGPFGPQKWAFWTSPPLPSSFLAHFVAKSGPFATFRGCIAPPAPPWLRACLCGPSWPSRKYN